VFLVSLQETVSCKDIILNFPEAGMHLRFEPYSQRLRLIEIYDLSRMQVRYGQSLVGGASNTATFVRIYDLFGPTFPGELDTGSSRYTLNYPGLSFIFPLQRQHAALLKEAELPLEFPDGTTPVASRICVYSGTINKLQSLNEVQPPPLPAGTHYFEKVTVALEHGLTFESIQQALLFGASPQDVWSLLGAPMSTYSKGADTMAIHSTAQGGSVQLPAGTDYVYNYFSRGLDILFCGKTHRVKKFVLHTNPPGHLEFNMYTKCNFEIPVAQGSALPSPLAAAGAQLQPVPEPAKPAPAHSIGDAVAAGAQGLPAEEMGELLAGEMVAELMDATSVHASEAQPSSLARRSESPPAAAATAPVSVMEGTISANGPLPHNCSWSSFVSTDDSEGAAPAGQPAPGLLLDPLESKAAKKKKKKKRGAATGW